MNRRQFLLGMAASGCASPYVAHAQSGRQLNLTQEQLWSQPRELWISRPESGELGRFTYWADGNVIEDQYSGLCRLMRDLHVNKTVAMHMGMVNFVYAVQQGIGHYFSPKPFVLTDGYRTNATNAGIENAAKDSKHMAAAAVDGRFDGVSIEDTFKLAAWFNVGGVGIYPRHVHIDAGATRRWAGHYGSAKRGGR